jgi:hypothetical protein
MARGRMPWESRPPSIGRWGAPVGCCPVVTRAPPSDRGRSTPRRATVRSRPSCLPGRACRRRDGYERPPPHDDWLVVASASSVRPPDRQPRYARELALPSASAHRGLAPRLPPRQTPRMHRIARGALLLAARRPHLGAPGTRTCSRRLLGRARKLGRTHHHDASSSAGTSRPRGVAQGPKWSECAPRFRAGMYTRKGLRGG